MKSAASDGAVPKMQPGEILLWRGTPYRGIRFRAVDGLIIPGSFFWLVFFAIWDFAAWRHARLNGLYFPLLGLPFALLGVYVTIGRFVFDSLERRKTAYLLTNRRIIIQWSSLHRQITALELSCIEEPRVEPPRGRFTSILFGRDAYAEGSLLRSLFPWFGRIECRSFNTVRDSEQVCEKMKHAREAAISVGREMHYKEQ